MTMKSDNYTAVLFCIIAQLLNTRVSVSINVSIAALLPDDNQRMFSTKRMAPAIEYAIEYVKHNTTLLPNEINLSVKYRDTKCSALHGINEAINFYVRKEVDVFFGPVCDYTLAPVARQTLFWNLPLITVGATAHDFKMHHEEYQMITKLGPVDLDMLALALIKILRYHNWNKFKIIYDANGQDEAIYRFCHLVVSGLVYKIKTHAFNVSKDYYNLGGSMDPHWQREVGVKYGVVVLCASANAVREIMIKARDLNFDNGEYVFFNIDLFGSENEIKRPWYREDDTDERNAKAKKAYEALMTVTLRKPTSPEYQNFSREMQRRANDRHENFTNGEEEEDNSFAGAFHDAVILYATVLNETLTANKSISNGLEMTRRMRNRTFKGITGTVSMDENGIGHTHPDFSLWDMNPETGDFEVVAYYIGKTDQYEPVEGKQIRWAGQFEHAPPDTPKCGFDNSKCPPEPFPPYYILIIVLSAMLVLFTVAACFIYRSKSLE